MASFDVESLFTNIPLYEIINICINELFPDPDSTISGIARQDFRKLLELLSTTESFFIFNGCYYKPIYGLAIGSPLGPSLANAFMCFYEKFWLDECPQEIKPLYYNISAMLMIFLCYSLPKRFPYVS